MNCQDISLALDDRDIGALNAARRREFDAHLAACPDCALDWNIHQRMLATSTPMMPSALPTRVRTLVAARAGAKGERRAPNRFVLLGTLLAVGAAAAMLITRMSGAPTSPQQAAASGPASESSATTAQATSDPSAPSGADQATLHSGVEQAGASAAEVPVKPFTVRVLPLQNTLKDPSRQAVVASLHEAFLERLRTVSGLTLLEPERGSDPEARPDYRITITGEEFGDSFGGSLGTLQAEMLRSDGTAGSTLYISSGSIMASCAGFPPSGAAGANAFSCVDPEGAAANFVRTLRTKMFPPDPSLRRQLQAQVADRSLSAQQRLQALLEASRFGQIYLGAAAAANTPGQELRDPALVRGAVDLATTAADPLRRAEVWATLRGVGNPGLIRPLLTAFRQDSDGEVRLAALGTLAADFGKDPGVHAAFETAAQKDARPLIRALAQRTLSGFSGDAAWRDYIIASLKDTNRSAVERVEALFYHMGLPVETSFFSGVRAPAAARIFRQFDHDAVRTLLELLPVAATESTMVKSATVSLMNDVIHIEDPAVTDMLLASLDGGSIWINRGIAVRALLSDSRRSDPRVQAALEKIGTGDPDPQVRQAVTASLQRRSLQPSVNMDVAQVAASGGDVSANGAEKPLSFGVNLSGMVAGPFVPKEMVGKAVVASVATESVGQRAGVMEGDVLLEINGAQLSSPAEIVKILAAVPRGVDVEVLVYRDGEKMSLRAQF